MAAVMIRISADYNSITKLVLRLLSRIRAITSSPAASGLDHPLRDYGKQLVQQAVLEISGRFVVANEIEVR